MTVLFKRNTARHGEPEKIEPYATTPNGAPYPLRSWVPDVAVDIQNLATWADTNTLSVFPNVAGRDAAFGSPANAALEGRTCYLKDTGTLQQHNGYLWIGDTAPVAFTYLNGFSAYGNSYLHMDHRGRVAMMGSITHANPSSLDFASLPANYRPRVLVGSTYLPCTIEKGATKYAANLLINNATGTMTAAGVPAGAGYYIYLNLFYQADFKAMR